MYRSPALFIAFSNRICIITLSLRFTICWWPFRSPIFRWSKMTNADDMGKIFDTYDEKNRGFLVIDDLRRACPNFDPEVPLGRSWSREAFNRGVKKWHLKE
jgi:hypothetical protein